MADSNDKSQTQETPEQIAEREKQTNRVFTQSDFDKMVSLEKRKIEEKYKDFDTIKSQYEELSKQAKERKDAEMSEIEKERSLRQKLEDEINKIKTDYNNQRQINIRAEILDMPEFRSLPRVYKNSVSLSEDRETIIESAKAVLKEFEADLGKKETFGIPKVDSGNGAKKDAQQTLAQRAKSVIAEHYKYYNKN